MESILCKYLCEGPQPQPSVWHYKVSSLLRLIASANNDTSQVNPGAVFLLNVYCSMGINGSLNCYDAQLLLSKDDLLNRQYSEYDTGNNDYGFSSGF